MGKLCETCNGLVETNPDMVLDEGSLGQHWCSCASVDAAAMGDDDDEPSIDGVTPESVTVHSVERQEPLTQTARVGEWSKPRGE